MDHRTMFHLEMYKKDNAKNKEICIEQTNIHYDIKLKNKLNRDNLNLNNNKFGKIVLKKSETIL